MVGDDILLEDFQPSSLVNNPTYGRTFLAGYSDGCSSSDSSDYLSVSVNPHYQSVAETMGKDHELNGMPIPVKKAGVTASVSFVDPPIESDAQSPSVAILSSSAPQPVTNPQQLSIRDEEAEEERSLPMRTESINSTNTAEEMIINPQYSYATQHNRRAVWITSDYANSPHFVRERPTHNYLPNPIQRIEEETEESVMQQCGEGSSTINSQSSASRLIYHKRLREADSSYRISKAKFELLLVMFAVLAILISITTISLCLLIIFQEMGARSHNDVSTLTITQSSPTTTAFSVDPLDSCQCSGKCYVYGVSIGVPWPALCYLFMQTFGLSLTSCMKPLL